MILDRSHAERFLAIYRERLYLVLAIAFFVCAAVGHRLATQAVMPIRQVGITAARISSSTLSERLQLTELPQELAAVARSFNAMMDRLQDAFSRLSRFSADIAHELRTPVSNMIGEMEVALGRHREEPFYRDAIGSALEECQRLSRVIDALLFLARAEDPRRQIRKEKVNLLREIQSVLDFYEAAASESGLSFQVEIPETLELAVERTLFHRAIANVISNAIKHARSTSPVQIKAAQADRAVEIEIRDQGQGISPEHLPHLSDRFYRVDASRSQDSGGSGLGLAIVKTIAHIHGGELILASQPGLGTRVILRFPV
jgi:two-component system heavy metal sensor histidine kinase CusS